MTEQVICDHAMLKRHPGRKLKAATRWPQHHPHQADIGEENDCSANDVDAIPVTRRRPPPELSLSGLRTRRASDASLRRLSCSNSPTLERASPRTLKSVGTLKDVVRTSRALDSPFLDGPATRDVNFFSDTWKCAAVDPDAHRHFLRSFSGEGHDIKSQRTGSIKASKLDRWRRYHKAHDFEIYSYKTPHWCGLCHNFIWGLTQQGMRCKGCKMDIHKHCYEAAMQVECTPSKKVVRQVFGIDLTTLAMMDDGDVPNVVRECVHAIESAGLSTKGIYRVSGQTGDVMDVREKYNKGEEVDFSLYTDINVITGVLKQYLRELPNPVITYDAYSEIMKAAAAVSSMEDGLEDYTVLSNALKLLPKAHYLLLKYLGEHLHKVVDHSSDNLVTVHNLAVTMAPTLMRAPVGNIAIYRDTHLQQYFAECVILKHDKLFS